MTMSLRDHCVMFGQFLADRPEIADHLGSPAPPDVTGLHGVMADPVVLEAWLRWLVSKSQSDAERRRVNVVFAQRGWPLIETTQDV
jgi:hypothetical protein